MKLASSANEVNFIIKRTYVYDHLLHLPPYLYFQVGL